jgi:hypothetical protein
MHFIHGFAIYFYGKIIQHGIICTSHSCYERRSYSQWKISLSKEEHVDRKRLSAGIALLAILIVLCIFGSNIVRNEWKSRQGQIGQREPLPGLGYCSSKQVRPCILSIDLSPGGDMLIDILVHGSSPDFYLKIEREGSEHMYECKKAESYSINVHCTGDILPAGETMSFLLISSAENSTLAEGSFPIIGLALATPDIAITPTPITIDRPPR